MKLEDNIRLAEFTTFRIGGEAKKFVTVSSVDELVEAVKYARENKLPIFVLGSGSNILMSDQGFDGMVIRMAIQGVEYGEEMEGRVRVTAAAGVIWNDLVEDTARRGLYGLENLSGIPGTVGAAPIQNIGAYGGELKDTFISLKALNTDTMKIENLSKEDCSFGYRDSFFKKKGNQNFIVTEITVELKKNGEVNISYPDLKKYFSAKENSDSSQREIYPLDVHEAVLSIRKAKLPDPKESGTAGSFFKNPIIPNAQFIKLQEKFKDMPSFAAGEDNVKVPAAWMIDKICGLKGFREGNIGTYPNQPLALVNYGGGSAKEVTDFAKMIEEKVKEKTDIKLEWEVQMIDR